MFLVPGFGSDVEAVKADEAGDHVDGTFQGIGQYSYRSCHPPGHEFEHKQYYRNDGYNPLDPVIELGMFTDHGRIWVEYIKMHPCKKLIPSNDV
jgi:hypothetical protein